MTRDEANQRLAEWLGWEYVQGSEESFPGWYGGPSEYCGPYRTSLPDFYTDESANALLLEKLAEEATKNETICALFYSRPGWDMETKTEMGDPIVAHSDDRKTAICEAAMKLIDWVKK